MGMNMPQIYNKILDLISIMIAIKRPEKKIKKANANGSKYSKKMLLNNADKSEVCIRIKGLLCSTGVSPRSAAPVEIS